MMGETGIRKPYQAMTKKFKKPAKAMRRMDFLFQFRKQNKKSSMYSSKTAIHSHWEIGRFKRSFKRGKAASIANDKGGSQISRSGFSAIYLSFPPHRKLNGIAAKMK